MFYSYGPPSLRAGNQTASFLPRILLVTIKQYTHTAETHKTQKHERKHPSSDHLEETASTSCPCSGDRGGRSENRMEFSRLGLPHAEVKGLKQSRALSISARLTHLGTEHHISGGQA